MKTHIFGIIALAAMMSFSGCTNSIAPSTDSPAEQAEVKYKSLNFNVLGFETVVEDLGTRADESIDNASSITHLTLKFFKAGSDDNYTLAYEIKKERSNSSESFGTISQVMQFGTYTLVIIANGGAEYYDIESPTSVKSPESAQKIESVFYYYQKDFTVSDNSEENISIELLRAIGAVGIYVMDTSFPDAFDHFDLTLENGSRNFNPSTGKGVGTATLKKENVKYANTNLSLFTFIPDDEIKPVFTVVAKDSEDETLKTRTFDEFTLEKNKGVSFQGVFFGKEENFTLTVSEQWEPDPIPFK